MNPVIFKLALGFNFSLLCPEGSKSFICLLFLNFVFAANLPRGGGAECHIKRTEVSVGNFGKSPKRYYDFVLWTWFDIFRT